MEIVLAAIRSNKYLLVCMSVFLYIITAIDAGDDWSLCI